MLFRCFQSSFKRVLYAYARVAGFKALGLGV